MKKLNSISSLINVLNHNPSPDNDKRYSKFIKMPLFVKIDSDDDAQYIIKKAFEHVSCSPDTICAPEYYLIASFIFADNEEKVIESYSLITEDISEEVFKYFFNCEIFAEKLSALRIDVFKALGARADNFVESQYVDTVVFYNE